MRRHFEDFDFEGFWDDCSYSKENYVEEPPTDELIAEVEEELGGYKLPASYIALMKLHNGGLVNKNCFPSEEPTYWATDHVAITGIYGIGRTKIYSLCGILGGKYMVEEGEYPKIGICICDTPSAGHDEVMLDYRKCGKRGEPEVVHVAQEFDYEITFLAKDFETFIRGLVDESVYEKDEEEYVPPADLEKVMNGRFSKELNELCKNYTPIPNIDIALRMVAKKITLEREKFDMEGCPDLLFEIIFLIYSYSHRIESSEHFSKVLQSLICFPADGEFATNHFDQEGFDSKWDEGIEFGYIRKPIFRGYRLSRSWEKDDLARFEKYIIDYNG